MTVLACLMLLRLLDQPSSRVLLTLILIGPWPLHLDLLLRVDPFLPLVGRL